MMPKLLYLAMSLLSLCPLSQAQQKQALTAVSSDTIPFILTEYNNISMEAILNKQDTVNLMFHTAAEGVTLTKEAVGKISSIHFNAVDTVQSWGGSSSARYSENNYLQLGSLHWDSLLVWEDTHSGQHTDGKFGLDFFNNKVVEINFDRQYLVVHPFLPTMDEGYEKIELIFDSGLPFIEGHFKIGETIYANNFLIHSGFGGSLLLDDAFVQANSLEDKLEPISERSLKDAFGNELKTINALLPAFQIGHSHFAEIPVGFFSGTIGRQKMSILGGDILKRFNVIIDLQNPSVYLKPNGSMGTPYAGSKKTP